MCAVLKLSTRGRWFSSTQRSTARSLAGRWPSCARSATSRLLASSVASSGTATLRCMGKARGPSTRQPVTRATAGTTCNPVVLLRLNQTRQIRAANERARFGNERARLLRFVRRLISQGLYQAQAPAPHRTGLYHMLSDEKPDPRELGKFQEDMCRWVHGIRSGRFSSLGGIACKMCDYTGLC